jgi:hypothetical protein
MRPCKSLPLLGCLRLELLRGGKRQAGQGPEPEKPLGAAGGLKRPASAPTELAGLEVRRLIRAPWMSLLQP